MPDIDEFSYLPAQAAAAGVLTPLPPVERISLTLDDGRILSALRFGSAPPEVTFLHGAGLNAHTWDTTILALKRPSLAIDLAGHGDSSWREDAQYVPRILAPDVVGALEAWTEGPQVLVGQSLGGLTATALAASRPDLVRALLVVDITPGVDPGAGPAQIRAFFAGPTDWASRDELVERAMSFGLGGGERAAVERGVFLNSRVRPDGRVEWKHHFAHLAAAGAAAGVGGNDALSAALSVSGWQDLSAVTAPVTLVRGESGYVTPADAEEFTRRVPGAAQLTVGGAGHNVHEDAPARLAEIIDAIVDEG